MVFHLEDNDTTSEIDQAILKVLLTGKLDLSRSRLMQYPQFCMHRHLTVETQEFIEQS